jgi:two-component system sensor histidine kinase NreB
VEVTIQQTEEGLIAEIIDRGKGFDPNLKPQGTGYFNALNIAS